MVAEPHIWQLDDKVVAISFIVVMQSRRPSIEHEYSTSMIIRAQNDLFLDASHIVREKFRGVKFRPVIQVCDADAFNEIESILPVQPRTYWDTDRREIRTYVAPRRGTRVQSLRESFEQ